MFTHPKMRKNLMTNEESKDNGLRKKEKNETKKNNAKQISNDTRLNELRRWFESIGDCV
tara:strand:- start:765 stop:941 length:177 start_codon:yes stop_codon:yes gene_type:complete